VATWNAFGKPNVVPFDPNVETVHRDRDIVQFVEMHDTVLFHSDFLAALRLYEDLRHPYKDVLAAILTRWWRSSIAPPRRHPRRGFNILQ
jgi:hypothetical protein